MQEVLIEIDPFYMKIWNFKKVFIKEVFDYSIRFTKISIRLIKYIFKFILKYTLKYIIKITPLFIRKKILSGVYYYPKIVALVKFLRLWIKRTGNLSEVLPTDQLIRLFIGSIIFPIFKIILNQAIFRFVILDELKKNLFIKAELKKIITEGDELIAESNIRPLLFYIKENSELSYAEQEIYRDLKINSIAN